MQLNNKRTNFLNRTLRRHSKNYMQVTNRHLKICSTLLIIRKMQSKITIRYYLMPNKVAIIFLKK